VQYVISDIFCAGEKKSLPNFFMVQFLLQGVLLIAVRRPFDLGDRVVITRAEEVDSPGAGASWFVEGNISIQFVLFIPMHCLTCPTNLQTYHSSRRH